jgi:hypothetical protein
MKKLSKETIERVKSIVAELNTKTVSGVKIVADFCGGTPQGPNETLVFFNIYGIKGLSKILPFQINKGLKEDKISKENMYNVIKNNDDDVVGIFKK